MLIIKVSGGYFKNILTNRYKNIKMLIRKLISMKGVQKYDEKD